MTLEGKLVKYSNAHQCELLEANLRFVSPKEFYHQYQIPLIQTTFEEVDSLKSTLLANNLQTKWYWDLVMVADLLPELMNKMPLTGFCAIHVTAGNEHLVEINSNEILSSSKVVVIDLEMFHRYLNVVWFQDIGHGLWQAARLAFGIAVVVSTVKKLLF